MWRDNTQLKVLLRGIVKGGGWISIDEKESEFNFFFLQQNGSIVIMFFCTEPKCTNARRFRRLTYAILQIFPSILRHLNYKKIRIYDYGKAEAQKTSDFFAG